MFRCRLVDIVSKFNTRFVCTTGECVVSIGSCVLENNTKECYEAGRGSIKVADANERVKQFRKKWMEEGVLLCLDEVDRRMI